jgi:hypothetical protein
MPHMQGKGGRRARMMRQRTGQALSKPIYQTFSIRREFISLARNCDEWCNENKVGIFCHIDAVRRIHLTICVRPTRVRIDLGMTPQSSN